MVDKGKTVQSGEILSSSVISLKHDGHPQTASWHSLTSSPRALSFKQKEQTTSSTDDAVAHFPSEGTFLFCWFLWLFQCN